MESLGEAALPALRKALEGQSSLELRRRVLDLLQKHSGDLTNPERLRVVRVIEVLERIGSPEARKLLAKLAGGAPDDLTTREAKMSLERLAARPDQDP